MAILRLGAGYNPAFHCGCAGFFDGSRQGIEAGACRHDVVQQGDFHSFKVGLADEGVSHVSDALLQWQGCLGRRELDALAGVNVERKTQFMCDDARDVQRLVETPFPQAFGM